MDTSKYLNRLTEINSDIELDMYKILRNCKGNKMVLSCSIMSIGKDENGIRCILSDNTPIRENNVEKNIEFLEEMNYLAQSLYII